VIATLRRRAIVITAWRRATIVITPFFVHALLQGGIAIVGKLFIMIFKTADNPALAALYITAIGLHVLLACLSWAHSVGCRTQCHRCGKGGDTEKRYFHMVFPVWLVEL
jgi:hypothetical protein